MKRYIVSSSKTDELRAKLQRAEEQDRVRSLVDPVMDAVMDQYTRVTGFLPSVGKFYYRPDLNSVLVEFTQDYHGGVTTLTWYTRPGTAKRDNPAMLSLDASDREIKQYAEQMVDRLKLEIRHTFKLVSDPYYTLDFPDYSVEEVVGWSRVSDKAKAMKFVQDVIARSKQLRNDYGL